LAYFFSLFLLLWSLKLQILPLIRKIIIKITLRPITIPLPLRPINPLKHPINPTQHRRQILILPVHRSGLRLLEIGRFLLIALKRGRFAHGLFFQRVEDVGHGRLGEGHGGWDLRLADLQGVWGFEFVLDVGRGG
jgi:hypothetical protein